VSNLHHSVSDDENDILLFAKMQEDVLNNYPNPERIGCFDQTTLRTFVETPGKLDLSDRKYLHVFECAECTRELIELRRVRAERLERTVDVSFPSSRDDWLQWMKPTPLAVVALLCAAVIIIAVSWRMYSARSTRETETDLAVLKTIDLSSKGVSRGLEQSLPPSPVPLPRKLIKLHLILPYFSPAGSYRVTVGKEANIEEVEVKGTSIAVAHGARTELSVQLDLRNIAKGSYYLGTVCAADGGSYFYPLVLH
jgi:hypothetical protein